MKRFPVLSTIFILAVPAAYFGLSLINGGDPQLVDVWVIEEDGPPVVTVLERRYFRGGRGSSSERFELAVFDLATGEERARREVTDTESDARFSVYRRVGSRAWAKGSKSGIELLDLRTAASLFTEAELVAKLPELAGGFKERDMGTMSEVDPPTTGLPLTLADGQHAWLTMEPSVSDKSPPTEPWKPGYHCGPDGGAKASCERRECIAFQSIKGSDAMALGKAPMWNQRQMVQINPRNRTKISAKGEPKGFFRPSLVNLADTKCAFELDGGVLVLHDSSVMEPREALLSLSQPDGTRVWTVPVAKLLGEKEAERKLEPFEAVTVGDAIVVMLSEAGRRSKHSLSVAVLDRASGAVRRVFRPIRS